MSDAAVSGAPAQGVQCKREPYVYTWAAIGNTNGAPIQRPGERATVQLTGTFGGTVTLQGSDDGVNYYTVKDRFGTACTATAAAGFDIANLPGYLRPSGGSGVSAVIATATVSNV
jgi:hypothetical protein